MPPGDETPAPDEPGDGGLSTTWLVLGLLALVAVLVGAYLLFAREGDSE